MAKGRLHHRLYEGVPHRVDVDKGLQVPCAALPSPLLVLGGVMGPPNREDGPQWRPSPFLPLCFHLLICVVEGLHHVRAEGTRVSPPLQCPVAVHLLGCECPRSGSFDGWECAQHGSKSFQTCGVVQILLKLTGDDIVTFRGRRSTLCGF